MIKRSPTLWHMAGVPIKMHNKIRIGSYVQRERQRDGKTRTVSLTLTGHDSKYNNTLTFDSYTTDIKARGEPSA